MIIRCLLMLWITVLVTGCTLKDEEQIITEAWHSGETLPVEIGKKYPPVPIAMTIDKGYNVLIDLSHQCSFNFMWGLPDMLHQKGFRSVSSQASLGSVLDEKGVSRIRIPYDPERKIYSKFATATIPRNFIIDKKGKIVEIEVGYTKEAFAKMIEKLEKLLK